jgi:hypothetical protein
MRWIHFFERVRVCVNAASIGHSFYCAPLKQMQTTAEVIDAEWDDLQIHYDHSPTSSVTYIYVRRRDNTHFEPWLVLAPSAILARVGRTGLGLYAARRIKQGDLIGKYGGNVVCTSSRREHALSSPPVRILVRQGADKLFVLRSQDGGWQVVNGEGAPLPTLSYANDPRGTRFVPNVDVSEWGYMRATAIIPSFELTSTLDDNIHSELKLDYGDAYWSMQPLVGTREMPLEVDES